MLPQIILFVIPLIATSLLQQLFNTADTVVVGRWAGSDSLAAVGSCGSLINLFVNFFLGLSAGAGVCVAHDIGAGHEENVRKTVHTSVLVALIAGMFVTLMGLILARPSLTLMGTDERVLDEAVLYMRAVFCGMPANMIYNYCASILRSKGDTVRPLIFLSVAGVANVIFNLISVIAFGLGALGVGMATAISQWISCILVLIYMMRMDGWCRIEWRRLRIDKGTLWRILRIGMPAGFQSVLFNISNVLIQSAINGFGAVAIAGNTAGQNLDSYIYVTQNALYHASLTFVAQNAGAKRYDRMKKSIFCCAAAVVIIGLTVGSLMYLCGEQLLGLYVPGDEAVIHIGMRRLTVMCLTYFLCGLMEVGSGTMRGLGKSILPTVVSLVGSCLLRIVWIYTIFAWWPVPAELTSAFAVAGYRMTVLYVSYPVTWVLTAATHFVCTAFAMRKFKKTHLEEIRI